MTSSMRRSYSSINQNRPTMCGLLAAKRGYIVEESRIFRSHLRRISTQEESSPQHPGFKFIREGKAIMSYAQNEEVFYNRVQIFNRDFSILVIRHFIKIREEESTKNHKKKLEHYRGTGSHLVRS